MLQRLIKIINDFNLSQRFISLKNISIPGDESVEPQNGILDDDLRLIFSLSHDFNDFRDTLVRTLEYFQLGIFCR
jgi:hypothetical protein